MSRWRTGGQTSFDLVREFTQELPRTSPADAWQRAILLTAGSRVNVDGEPRIKRGTADDPPKANHPFFWAGYMLVDCGTAAEAKPDEPVLKIKPPKPPVEEDKPQRQEAARGKAIIRPLGMAIRGAAA